MPEKTVQSRINAEKNRLTRIFKDVDKSAQSLAKSLIKNAAFMSITLEDLQEAINKNGVTVEYKNGENQFGTKKSPEIETYNSMIKNFSTIMSQLARMTPEGSAEADELLEFLAGRKERAAVKHDGA